MATKFLSPKLSWKRVGFGVLMGALILFLAALVFVLLATNGLLFPRQ